MTEQGAVSLNSDMGESIGLHSFGNDDGLLEVVDTANVACGFHAGDPGAMRELVGKAAAAGVSVGAHPGLPDLVGFGRREMRLNADDLRDLVLYQVGALKAFLDAQGLTLHHLKAHGSMYGMVAREEPLMDALCDVAEQFGVPVMGMAGTLHEKVAQRRGVPFIAELYVDLAYHADGSLAIVRRPTPTPVPLATERAARALAEGVVLAEDGERVPIRFDSICIHSDVPGAVDVARAVRALLDSREPS